MARPIAETPILYGADAQRFESLIQNTKPYPKEKMEQLHKTYEDFKRKVKIIMQSCCIRLSDDYPLESFDCGDEDLNDFLLHDAKAFQKKQIANTYILESDGNILAYFCISNDKFSRQNSSNTMWKRIKKEFPIEKQFSSYPSVKIGRFAVDKAAHGTGLGSELMTSLKFLLKEKHVVSAFRFLTVDAYIKAIPFYEKNDFRLLLPNDPNEHTKTMFFDMYSLYEQIKHFEKTKS